MPDKYAKITTNMKVLRVYYWRSFIYYGRFSKIWTKHMIYLQNKSDTPAPKAQKRWNFR